MRYGTDAVRKIARGINRNSSAFRRFLLAYEQKRNGIVRSAYCFVRAENPINMPADMLLSLESRNMEERRKKTPILSNIPQIGPTKISCG